MPGQLLQGLSQVRPEIYQQMAYLLDFYAAISLLQLLLVDLRAVVGVESCQAVDQCLV